MRGVLGQGHRGLQRVSEVGLGTGGHGRVSTEDYSSVLLTEPDMRARIRLFGSIDQNASESWVDTCGWLISFQTAVSEAIRPVNQDGG